MIRTRARKIYRDILARKGRSGLVILSILIGVFGVTTLISLTDILNRQLEKDIRSAAISHQHIYVTATGDPLDSAKNEAILDRLRQLPGVTDVEGQAVYQVSWRPSSESDYNDGFIVAFSEPFGEADLESISRVTDGRYPAAGANEIAVEQRFADRHKIEIGDKLVFRQPSGASLEWKVVGFVLHPYFTIAPALQENIQPSDAIYATYEDAQALIGFPGLSGIHVRYIDKPTAEGGMNTLMETLARETPYVAVFTFADDPEDNYIMTLISQINSTLMALGIIAMVVAGFLVTNVMNTIIVEQRKQIGAMKAIGASRWDSFVIYAGIALSYGFVGTLIGVVLALPVAAFFSTMIAEVAFTYIDGFHASPLGLGIGIAMGLLVPVLAAFFPVLNGTRISIRDAMTDLGIASNWGSSRASRLIGSLPLPRAIVQALSNIYQKKARLLLTGLTLTLAVAAFIGVTAVYSSLDDFVNGLYDSFEYEISLTPQEAQDYTRLQTLLSENITGIESIHAGYSVSVGVSGFESTNPLTAGSDQVTVTGIDPAQTPIRFDLVEGEGWQDNPARRGVILSRPVAENLDKSTGDSITLSVGGQVLEYDIIGVDSYAFDAMYMDWRELATLAGYVDAAGNPIASVIYINLSGEPSIEAVADRIDEISTLLLGQGIQATYINQPKVAQTQVQQISMFGTIFNVTSVIMAAVGAIGLMAALSMAVLERQKEIGVMRSIGAGSFSIMSQFLSEGVIVGVLAWMVAIPVSVALAVGLMGVLPFDYLDFAYPPQVVMLGLVSVVIVAAVASLWPSLMASRKTVADILRYQ